MIYALDFDGIICDSAIETGISGWKAACQIWDDMPKQAPADKIAAFRQARPIIETGYEAILAMRMLHLGASVEVLYLDHTAEFKRLMQEASVDVGGLKTLFGATRDAWIAEEKDAWVAQNPLYTGVAAKLIQLNQTHPWYIVTTKQERFVQMILAGNQIELADDRIFGLDRNLSKVEVLKLLIERHPGQPIQFVEDRVLTLLKIRQDAELSDVELVFGLWGYNSAEDKQLAQSEAFKCQTLEAFLI